MNDHHDRIWTCFGQVATGNVQNDEDVQKSSIAHEIDFYQKTVRLDWTADPYKQWSVNAKQYPSLSKSAMIYPSSPGTSVYSERLFSEAGIAYAEKRTRLLPTDAETNVFINYNLPLIDFNY